MCKPLWLAVMLIANSSTSFALENNTVNQSGLPQSPSKSTVDVAQGDLTPTELTLEQLMNVEITSIMKTATRLSDTPGAIYVLSSDDIKRTGATTIPEALRVVPGLNVARIDTNKWAISARGFNGEFSNKLLVLIDGRSIYTPLFSGVWWDQQDVMIEDIERIEVIRGPNASLWGANAVNGVVNIITKNAKHTLGSLVSTHIGSERTGAGLRYGAKIDEETFINVYGRISRYKSQNEPLSNININETDLLNKIGFRYDKQINSNNMITLKGDVFNGDSSGAAITFPTLSNALTPQLIPPYSESVSTRQEFIGYNLQGRWEQVQSKNSNTTLQVYWDNHKRESDVLNSTMTVNSFDIDFQQNLLLTSNQRLVWGLGYRRNMLEITNGLKFSLSDPDRVDNLFNFFLQDDITLVPSKLKLTLGNRIEHNPSTGVEFEPNARLLWTPNDHQSVWASISRAVRSPNWVQNNSVSSVFNIPPVGGAAATPFNPVILVTMVGKNQVKSENLIAYELGWRGVIKPQLTADAAIYYYEYKDAASVSPDVSDFSHIASGYILQNVYGTNFSHINTYGGEISIDWQVMNSWKLRGSYSYFQSHFSLSDNAPAGSTSDFKNSYPSYQTMLWSQHQLSTNVNLDINLRHISKINTTPKIDAYTALDARIAWNLNHQLELAVVGRNLFHDRHTEFGSDFLSAPTEVPRELFATAKYKF